MTKTNSKTIQLKAIFVTNTKKDGTTYKTIKTIMRDGSWVALKFDSANVNTNAWKGKSQLLTVNVSDTEYHDEYTDKEQKLHKAYIWIANVQNSEPLQVKRKTCDASMFAVDDAEVDTEITCFDGVPSDDELSVADSNK